MRDRSGRERVRASNGGVGVVLRATFYGVRGSTPCSCSRTHSIGGNTSCVLVEIEGDDPIILDLGTGLRYLGKDLMARLGPGEHLRATALVSHLHFDHIQGMPFFAPLLVTGSVLSVIGPRQAGSTLASELASFVRPPVFPIALEQFPGEVTCIEADDDVLAVGSAKVTCFQVPHVGRTNGYRIDVGNASLAYISDHQQPLDGSLELPQHVVEACEGVDVLIHDAQFDEAEFAVRADWGHCTTAFAATLARRCGAARLVLFHHDPSHDDAWIAAAVEHTTMLADGAFEVIAAHEGLSLASGS